VLILFGVAVRIVLWPLNQSSMRTSLKMQRIQPELTAIQARYKSDPEKLQAEMMKVYKSHGMTPFSGLAGCLPALLPMPVLITLFFVFQNTIEFRGVPFLWLTDISVHDPLFILPILMGASAYLLSWIGMRNMPPNPQTQMMSYMFPAMMLIFFIKAAAGLNLYYAVQNVAALPQQWLLSQERAKSGTGTPPAATPPTATAAARPSGSKKESKRKQA
jgi:YidC/Oxa1 family membrane protein insertase